MRLVIQRVSTASVTVAGEMIGQIGPGLLVLIGIGPDDDRATVTLMAEKTVNLRIFGDDQGRTNLSLLETGGAALLVSQFTLYADLRRGRRPSFIDAAPPDVAAPLVDAFAEQLRGRGVAVAVGRFGASMQVGLVNDGPVTILLDSATFREPRRS